MPEMPFDYETIRRNASNIPKIDERLTDVESCLKGSMDKPGRLSQMDDHEKRITSIERAMGGAVRALWALILTGFIGIVSFVWTSVIR